MSLAGVPSGPRVWKITNLGYVVVMSDFEIDKQAKEGYSSGADEGDSTGEGGGEIDDRIKKGQAGDQEKAGDDLVKALGIDQPKQDP